MRKGDKTVDVALRWLDGTRKRDKFFLWVHLFDPHWPHRPPHEFLDIFKQASQETGSSFIRFLLDDHHVDFSFFENADEKMLKLMNGYDGEVRFADAQIRRLYEFCEERELNSRTLWIITSDHGEGLGNHAWRGHGKHIYKEQIHVPLIFHFPSGAIHGQSRGETVELIDLAPTVLALLGEDAGELDAQPSPPQGVSLAPLFRREFPPSSGERHAFIQRRIFDPDARFGKDGREREKFEEGEKYALQNPSYKYIYRTQGGDELYDLKKDPYEVNNIAGTAEEVREQMYAMLLERLDTLSETGKTAPASVDKATMERLRSLGYTR